MKVKVKSEKPFWSMDVVCSGKGNQCKNGENGCIPCGSTLEIDLNDIFVTTAWHYDERDTYYTIKCSECGSLTDINPKELPSEIKSYVDARYKKQLEKERERWFCFNITYKLVGTP